ncbi:MAG: metallophosphoesterase family protein [Treponema sp.]|jgi:putative phosphoesterase|nr:metallophosphoesterase family protein [Treponema sp.]
MSSVLVLSDSHGRLPFLGAALRWAVSAQTGGAAEYGLAPRAAVFLGDGAEDLGPASREAGFALPWYRVRGNGDFDRRIPDTLVLDTAAETAGITPRGFKLFLAHGNRHRVETGFETLAAAARAAGAEAALFGHIHAPVWERAGGVWLLNPGSIGRPRTGAGATFAVLEIPETVPPSPRGLSARFFSLRETERGITVSEYVLHEPAKIPRH